MFDFGASHKHFQNLITRSWRLYGEEIFCLVRNGLLRCLGADSRLI